MNDSPRPTKIVACCLALAILLAHTAVPTRAAEPAVVASKMVLIRFEGEITPFREAYFLRKLDKAESLGADVVVVEIDSPGGYVESSLNLAAALRDVDWAVTVAYIPRKALSGAAIMALGCDEIIMSRTARIGDAGPIFMDEDFLFKHAPEKIRSDLARQVRDLSESQGRPPALAEAMVDMDLIVYEVTNIDTGETTFKSDAELESLADPTEWRKGPPVLESSKDRFLELNGARAVQLGVAQGVAASRGELAARFGATENQLTILEVTWIDTLVMALNSWPVTALLFVVGLIALYIELAAPGTGVGGLISGLCFALFFWSRFLGGTAGWLEVVLFLAGVAFLLVELFVIPGFGVAGVTGLLLLITSVVMASQRFSSSDGVSMGGLTQSLLLLSGAAIVAIVGVAVLSRYFGALPLFNRLLLEPPTLASPTTGAVVDETTRLAAALPVEAETPLSVGDTGIADSPLRPAGRVQIGEAYFDVITDGSFVEKGSAVRVIKISGTHITVREVAS